MVFFSENCFERFFFTHIRDDESKKQNGGLSLILLIIIKKLVGEGWFL